MPDFTLPLLLFLLPLAYSPGPGNMFFAANGARFGVRATIAANTGYHLATWIVTLLVGLGFGKIATSSSGALIIIKYAGSIYVLYLAQKLFFAGAAGQSAAARAAGFWSGALLLLLNPKAYLILALMFSQFTTATSGRADILWITTLFTLNNLIAFYLWTMAGDRLAGFFQPQWFESYVSNH